MVVLGLHCCTQSFSRCSKQGLLSSFSPVASHCGGLSCYRAWALGLWASVVVALGPSFPTACGIFLDQGLNLCPLHWQADS